MGGSSSWPSARLSVIGPDGVVGHVIPRVTPRTHDGELAAVDAVAGQGDSGVLSEALRTDPQGNGVQPRSRRHRLHRAALRRLPSSYGDGLIGARWVRHTEPSSDPQMYGLELAAA